MEAKEVKKLIRLKYIFDVLHGNANFHNSPL